MDMQELVKDLLNKAKAKGATEADALAVKGESFWVRVRMGEVDTLENANEHRLGLRLFFGKRSAVASTSDFSPESLTRLVDDTCDMAKATAEDDAAGLPSPDDYAKRIPELELWDPKGAEFPVEERVEMARRVEKASLDYDPEITNSEGGSFSYETGSVCYGSSHGFTGHYQGSTFSISATPVAMRDEAMQRDYWFSTKRRLADLDNPEEVGKIAAMRALRRLGARKVQTQTAPVVFDPLIGTRLLSYLASSLSGYALYKGASYQADNLGKQVASEHVNVLDDGILPGGLGSRPFDAEGLATRRTPVIEKGVLNSYLLDTYSAKKMNMKSTGNAVRGLGEAPTVGTNNFHLAPGPWSQEEIIGSISSGFYVTELMGFGVNVTTGDFSQGASGIWIENGELAYPIEEVTIAGKLQEIFLNIDMVGKDLVMHGKISVPTIKVSSMTIAGT